MGLTSELEQALASMAISTPTEIQALAFPLITNRQSVFIASHTGSGKTLAYLLPIFQELKRQENDDAFVGKPRKPRVLILGPTRELTDQIAMVAKSLSHFAKVRTAVANAGNKPAMIKRSLGAPIDVLVATPNKLIESMSERNLAIGDVQYLVLDEADTMLDRGFLEDVNMVLGPLGKRGGSFTTVLASATMTKAVKDLISSKFPGMTCAETSTLHKGVSGSKHSFLPLEAGRGKMDMLTQVISSDSSSGRRVMIFCNSIQSCRAVDHHLNESGQVTVCYHGEMPPPLRKTAIQRFTDPTVAHTPMQPLLVCTDLAARGLDMPAKVDHIVNFDMPMNPIDYLHRSGRTARAGAHGQTSTLLQSAMDRTLGSRIEWALNNGEPLDTLSALKEDQPLMTHRKKYSPKEKGSHHQKADVTRGGQSGGRGQGRGASSARGGRVGGRGEDSTRGRGTSRGRAGAGRFSSSRRGGYGTGDGSGRLSAIRRGGGRKKMGLAGRGSGRK